MKEFAQPLQVEPKRKYGLGKNASQGAKTAVTERITGVWHWLARIELLFIQELLTPIYIRLDGYLIDRKYHFSCLFRLLAANGGQKAHF